VNRCCLLGQNKMDESRKFCSFRSDNLSADNTDFLELGRYHPVFYKGMINYII
jgi:hypothetical protein